MVLPTISQAPHVDQGETEGSWGKDDYYWCDDTWGRYLVGCGCVVSVPQQVSG